MRSAARKKITAALAGEKDPLSILLGIAADDEQEVGVRVQAAAYAAPYCYPRLSAMVVADASQQLGKRDASRLLEEITARIARVRGALPPPAPVIDADLESAPLESVPVDAGERN